MRYFAISGLEIRTSRTDEKPGNERIDIHIDIWIDLKIDRVIDLPERVRGGWLGSRRGLARRIATLAGAPTRPLHSIFRAGPTPDLPQTRACLNLA